MKMIYFRNLTGMRPECHIQNYLNNTQVHQTHTVHEIHALDIQTQTNHNTAHEAISDPEILKTMQVNNHCEALNLQYLSYTEQLLLSQKVPIKIVWSQNILQLLLDNAETLSHVKH